MKTSNFMARNFSDVTKSEWEDTLVKTRTTRKKIRDISLIYRIYQLFIGKISTIFLKCFFKHLLFFLFIFNLSFILMLYYYCCKTRTNIMQIKVVEIKYILLWYIIWKKESRKRIEKVKEREREREWDEEFSFFFSRCFYMGG